MRCTSLTYHLVKGHFLQVQQGSWNKRTKHLKYKFLIKGYRNYMEHSGIRGMMQNCKVEGYAHVHAHTQRSFSHPFTCEQKS